MRFHALSSERGPSCLGTPCMEPPWRRPSLLLLTLELDDASVSAGATSACSSGSSSGTSAAVCSAGQMVRAATAATASQPTAPPRHRGAGCPALPPHRRNTPSACSPGLPNGQARLQQRLRWRQKSRRAPPPRRLARGSSRMPCPPQAAPPSGCSCWATPAPSWKRRRSLAPGWSCVPSPGEGWSAVPDLKSQA